MQDWIHLDWTEVLNLLKSFATSQLVGEKIQHLAPLATKALALESFSQIHECQHIMATGQRPFMSSLDIFSVWHERLKKKAHLKPVEIRDVRQFCLEALALEQVLLKIQSGPWLTSIKDDLMDSERVLSAIDQILTPQGDIRMDASQRLYELHKEKESLERQVKTILDRHVRDHDMEAYLQDKYVTTREGRWVLPIKSGMQNFINGIVHARSQSRQTVFLEPETAVPLNNRARQCEIDIEEEIERLLIELSEFLSSQTSDFDKTKIHMMTLDQKLAETQLAERVHGCACEFSEEIDLKNVRHPLLAVSAKDVVANDIHLASKNRLLLLSGPNAGGKTVLLKSIGLSCQMARCGLFICADEGSKLPFIENIKISIGDAQSVDHHLSTFAAHLKVLNESLALKGQNQLILIDEICGSTDPEEGSVLARSFIEAFAANKCFAVITSHLGPLKIGWDADTGVVNGSLEYDTKTGKPTYRFLPGIPGDSLALQTAQRVGVREDVVKRALELLTPEARQRWDGMREIERIKQDLSLLRKQADKDQQEAKATQQKYQTLLQQFEKEKEAWLSKSIKKAEKKLDEYVSQAKVQEVFKKFSDVREIKNQMPEIVKVNPNAVSPNVIKTPEEFAQKFPPGSKVFIPSLNQDGIVQSTPNGKGDITVLSQSLRLTLPWIELKGPQKPENPTTQILRQSTSAFHYSPLDQDRTLDLRGKTVEEALSKLEMALDDAIQRQDDRLKVIHGFGSEVLKKSLRTHLSRSIYVKKWKAGSPETGGDGVTWVELKDE